MEQVLRFQNGNADATGLEALNRISVRGYTGMTGLPTTGTFGGENGLYAVTAADGTYLVENSPAVARKLKDAGFMETGGNVPHANSQLGLWLAREVRGLHDEIGQVARVNQFNELAAGARKDGINIGYFLSAN